MAKMDTKEFCRYRRELVCSARPCIFQQFVQGKSCHLKEKVPPSESRAELFMFRFKIIQTTTKATF